MSYAPLPMDVSDVVLSQDLMDSIETLAENVHDQWAARRIEEGWAYGPERSDADRLHPSLVSYTDLSEAEKQYDRTTAISTLRALLKLGFKITNEPEREPNV